jgi:tetratricopeptide (TPR) repeat protein
MENTPLEIYETAYKLHYSEHRIADAVIYYQRLIHEFPESNECGYAVIQLQKIKASEVARDLNSILASRKPSFLYIPILLVVTVILSGAIGYLYFYFHKAVVTEQNRVSLAFNAISKILLGNYEDALLSLNDLKEFKKDDIMPFELCADIYRKDNKFDLARNEYQTFFQINPALKPSENEKRFMKLDDHQTNKSKTVEKMQPSLADQLQPLPVPEKTLPIVKTPVTEKLQSSTKKPTADKTPPPTKTPAVSRGKKKNVNPPPPPPVKSGNGLYLVDPDSLSYF